MKNKEAMLWNEKMERIPDLVYNMGWDYDRLSSSGRIYYEELCILLNVEL